MKKFQTPKFRIGQFVIYECYTDFYIGTVIKIKYMDKKVGGNNISYQIKVGMNEAVIEAQEHHLYVIENDYCYLILRKMGECDGDTPIMKLAKHITNNLNSGDALQSVYKALLSHTPKEGG